MSADLGGVQAGFVKNFAYGTISLTANTSVELVDQSANTTSGETRGRVCERVDRPGRRNPQPEQLSPLRSRRPDQWHDLGGTVTVVSSGGAIAVNTPTPGHVSPAGAIQNWTFFGTDGESITIQLNPGANGPNPAIAPHLNWGQVRSYRGRQQAGDGVKQQLGCDSRRSRDSHCPQAEPTRSRSWLPLPRAPAPATTCSRRSMSRPA